MTKKQKTIAIVLFILGALFFGASFTLFKEGNIASGIFGLVLAAACFIIPVRRILDHVSQKKASGQNWIALPIAAISLPLAFGCMGLTSNSSTKKEDKPETTEISISDIESTITSEIEETTTISVTTTPFSEETTTEVVDTKISEDPTTMAEDTTTVIEEPTTIISEEPTTTTEKPTEKPITKETKKPTVKESTKQQTTTVTPKETKAPTETVAPTAAATKEPSKSTKAPDSTTIEVVSEARDYVLNNSRMKFHKPGCYSAKQIADHNREERHCKREELINEGYLPCGNCNP